MEKYNIVEAMYLVKVHNLQSMTESGHSCLIAFLPTNNNNSLNFINCFVFCSLEYKYTTSEVSKHELPAQRPGCLTV